jgi:uncharacterized protein
MWSELGRGIIRYRVWILLALGLITAFMAWQGSKVELTYTYARALPKTDPAYIAYEDFRSRYGEDGNVLVIGVANPDLFKLENFNRWYDLAEEIKKIEGIKDVMGITHLYNLHRNDSLQKFDIEPIIKSKPRTQEELDSLKELILSLPFYEGLAYNKETHATLLAVTFHEKQLNSRNRISIVENIVSMGDAFGKATGSEMHYSGMPFIRTNFMKKVASEMQLFLILALLVTTIILWIFFKYFNAVFFSLIVVVVSVVWSLGILQLFGYQITILTGLLPPLTVIIGLPNCIFLINKYQEELLRHGNKAKALSRMVEKVGLSNFLANVTTAIGFGVFYFTNSSMLVEFGLVAAVNVLTTYGVALFFIPAIFSYLPVPSLKHTRHLKGKRINFLLKWVDVVVHRHRKLTYLIVVIVTLISAYGMTRIKVLGYVVDDLPQKDPVYHHLRFFEHNFGGVLPFEITIDTGKEGGVFAENGNTLYKIKNLQKQLAEFEELSKPLSVVEALKFAYQGYRDGNSRFYLLPGSTELKKLSDYSGSLKGKEGRLSSFLDSTRRYTRISYQVADIGSVEMKNLYEKVVPKIDSIFPKEEYNVSVTGFSYVFLKGNDYLFRHLFVSLVIAIVLILLIGMVLFRSVAIIVLSKAPALIPLIFTAGLMGFLDIPFKPSTILIFSIAFGIASDGTIYILTEYRNQLINKKLDPARAISQTIVETGLSMIYTAVILFCGFAIFAASSFGGTVALGILVSVTLLISLATNLVLLPCILISLEKRSVVKALKKEPLINIIDEDEDIDLDKLTIQKVETENTTREPS